MYKMLIFTVLFASLVIVEPINTKNDIDYSVLTKPLFSFNTFEALVRSKLQKDESPDYLKIATMFDASTKIPSGLLAGNFFDYGNFDECYNLQWGKAYGKYCLGVIPLNKLAMINKNYNHTQKIIPFLQMNGIDTRIMGVGSPDLIGYFVAFCGLSTMTTNEMNSVSSLLTFTEEMCSTKAIDDNMELTGGAIATISVLAIIIGAAVVQTIYDITLYYKKQTPSHELLIAFSFLTNGRKIFTSSNNSEQLLCLNGIKALSMFWVIIGHVFFNIMFASVSNSYHVFNVWINELSTMFVLGSTVSVDTFFCVGGLVTVYTYLKATNKGVQFNIVLYYIHRFLRLTPAFAIVILIHVNLLDYLPKGPLSFIFKSMFIDNCKQYWWQSLFYINNYFDKGSCIGQTWYLQVDFQLFLLSPIVLLPMIKYSKITKGLLGAFISAGFLVPLIIAWTYPIKGIFKDSNYTPKIYNQTYARFGPYVIGMLAGYLIYNYRQQEKKLKLPMSLVLSLWAASLALLVTCVYAGKDLVNNSDPSLAANSIYIGFNRNAWSIAVAIIIFLCVFDYGGPINAFLSLPIFQIITKLSYSMYLVHFSLIFIRSSLRKEVIKFSNLTMLHTFWGDFMFTLVFSAGLCLLFESPIIILEKYMFSPFKKSKK